MTDTKIPMTDEEWEKNKSCDLKGRTHKYKWDPERPGTNWAQCVHCGVYTELDRKVMDGYDELGIERK